MNSNSKKFQKLKKGLFVILNVNDEIVVRQILLNQREILKGLSKLLTPSCKGSYYDKNGETRCNIALISRYHETEQILGLKWGETVGFSGESRE